MLVKRAYQTLKWIEGGFKGDQETNRRLPLANVGKFLQKGCNLRIFGSDYIVTFSTFKQTVIQLFDGTISKFRICPGLHPFQSMEANKRSSLHVGCC